MEALLQDVRYTWAMMRRNVACTTAGLVTLALGTGATAAVFSVVYGVLMQGGLFTLAALGPVWLGCARRRLARVR